MGDLVDFLLYCLLWILKKIIAK